MFYLGKEENVQKHKILKYMEDKKMLNQLIKFFTRL